MNAKTLIQDFKGIGEKTAALFNKLGIYNAGDLVTYYPRSYDVYESICALKDASLGERNVVLATVKSTPKVVRFNGKSIVSFFVTDGENSCEVRFFNSPFLAKAIKVNDIKVFRGFLKQVKDRIVIEQPKMYSEEEYRGLENTITPIYSLTKDLSNERIKKCIKSALAGLDLSFDYMDAEDISKYNLLSLSSAYQNIHFPCDYEKQYFARRRIVLDEFLHFIQISKEGVSDLKRINNLYPMIEVSECKRLEEALPYKLTNAQKNAIKDITDDMCGEFLMNRLVQGDVGSGKTIVAVMGLLLCVCNGYQASMMAPTEVLARQHFETILSFANKFSLPFKPVLLVGKMSSQNRRVALEGIENGDYNVVIGTHAVFQEKVCFKNLSLVITDEQHRFGVKQREAFKNKGLNPHLLVMSATPIPRTLAMVAFAGLSVSVIDEMPKNRIPISNCVVNSGFRMKAYEKIKSEIKKGRQAYIICPMVYENEENDLGLKSVEQYSKDIRDYFPEEEYRIATLSGKMRPEDKSAVMENFKDHNYDILVSTTVIEVGIDVPNASVIMIENAERFGLSQLHQLRGRVGRGQYESFCILISDSKKEETQKRLKVLNETNDGFKIAEEDMRLRGPGELNGIRQSGELQFGLGDITEDGDILLLAASLYEKYKDCITPGNANMIDFRTI